MPGFGIPDLLVTWDPAWPVVLEAGWGLFAAVLVAAAFLAVAARPHDSAAPLVQLWTATAALGVSALAGAEVPLVSLISLLAIESAVVTGLAASLPGYRPIRPLSSSPSHSLLAVAVAGVVPWTLYAVAMYRANRRSAPADIIFGVDHYAVRGALAIALVALALLAALWHDGRRYFGVSAGLAATGAGSS